MAFWSKKIINSNENLLSLDISDSSIKVFQLERSGSVDRVRSFGIKDYWNLLDERKQRLRITFQN